MLTQFLARHNPDSTNPKPRFMKKPRNAVTKVHMVSIPTFTPSIGGAAGCSCADRVAGMHSVNKKRMATTPKTGARHCSERRASLVGQVLLGASCVERHTSTFAAWGECVRADFLIISTPPPFSLSFPLHLVGESSEGRTVSHTPDTCSLCGISSPSFAPYSELPIPMPVTISAHPLPSGQTVSVRESQGQRTL